MRATFRAASAADASRRLDGRAAARARFGHLADEATAADESPTSPDRPDPDNPPLTDAELAALRPAMAVHPRLVEAAAARRFARREAPAPKVSVSLRLDVDVVAALRATGSRWQPRANAMLRRALGLDPGGTDDGA